jgi:hypothetical protein
MAVAHLSGQLVTLWPTLTHRFRSHSLEAAFVFNESYPVVFLYDEVYF